GAFSSFSVLPRKMVTPQTIATVPARIDCHFTSLNTKSTMARQSSLCPVLRNGHGTATKDEAATLEAKTRHREVSDEGDCGDESAFGNGRAEASGAARAAGGDKRRSCSDSCVRIHRG